MTKNIVRIGANSSIPVEIKVGRGPWFWDVGSQIKIKKVVGKFEVRGIEEPRNNVRYINVMPVPKCKCQ